MTDKLKGKVAIITGGNSGIGESTAELFAAEGASVVIAARREDEGLKVRDSIRTSGGSAEFVRCDVTKPSDIKTVVAATIDIYKGIGMICNIIFKRKLFYNIFNIIYIVFFRLKITFKV